MKYGGRSSMPTEKWSDRCKRRQKEREAMAEEKEPTCKHEHTHPNGCDDCGAPWCDVCCTWHYNASAYACGKMLRERYTALMARAVRIAQRARLALSRKRTAYKLRDEVIAERDDLAGGIDSLAEQLDAIIAERDSLKDGHTITSDQLQVLQGWLESQHENHTPTADAREPKRMAVLSVIAELVSDEPPDTLPSSGIRRPRLQVHGTDPQLSNEDWRIHLASDKSTMRRVKRLVSMALNPALNHAEHTMAMQELACQMPDYLKGPKQ
jgi:hypothetical protein